MVSAKLVLILPLLLLLASFCIPQVPAKTVDLNLCFFFINSIELAPPSEVDYVTFPRTGNVEYDDIDDALAQVWYEHLRSQLGELPTPLDDHLYGFAAIWSGSVAINQEQNTFKLRKDYPVSLRSGVEFYSEKNCSLLKTSMQNVILNAVRQTTNRVLLRIDKDTPDTLGNASRLEVYRFGTKTVSLNSTTTPSPSPGDDPNKSSASIPASPMMAFTWVQRLLSA